MNLKTVLNFCFVLSVTTVLGGCAGYGGGSRDYAPSALVPGFSLESAAERQAFKADLRRLCLLGAVEIYNREEGLLLRTGSVEVFKPGSATIERDAMAVLHDVAAVLRDFRQTEVVVISHADGSGSAPANMALTEQRARAVGRFLRSVGIPCQRIRLAARGEHDPIADNRTPEGRRKNRRIEFLVASHPA